MKPLLALVLTSFALSASAQYSYQDIFQDAVSGLNPVALFGGSTDFESIDMSDDFFAGNTEEASITTDDTVATAIPAANRPANYPYAATRDKVLAVDAATNAPVFRNLNADGSAPEVGYVYADMLIKGDAHKWNEEVLPTSAEDKILVYFKETAENGVVVGTNLYVRAGAMNQDWDGSIPDGYEYKLTTPGVATIEADAWYRIVLIALSQVGVYGPGFKIYLGGYGPDYLCSGPGMWMEDSGEFETEDGMDTSFLALTYNEASTNDYVLAGTMKSLGFAGNVSVDDFVVTTADPARVAVTLSWPDGLRDLYCVVGTATNSLDDVTSPLTLQVPAGTEVALGGYTDYRFLSKSLTVSGADSTLSLPEQGIFWYFPQTDTPDQDGTAENPFEIATDFDLFILADAVAAGYGADLCYVQVDDIDMGDAIPFPGIGTYNADPRLGTPFSGTYDGGNYAIFDITFTTRNYGGVFNQVNGGTIKNLVVENISVPTDATGEYGYAIVGNAGNGAKLLNLTSMGSFGSAEKPGTHNMAGIVVRACGGGEDGTLVQGCVNQASIYGSYTKIGGICAITQHKVDGEPITFDICSNQGTIVSSRTGTGVTGYAGIVGYVDDDTVLENCFNTGAIVNESGANTDCDGTLVGWAYGSSLTDNGGNSATADTKMVGKYQAACTVTGFQFATVDDGAPPSATTTDSLDTDETYLLERNVATSADPVFTLDAEGDTIAFDTILGYTFDGTIAAGDGLATSCATNGTVITYTAVMDVPPAPISQYKVEIDGVDVPIRPTAEDFAAMAAAVPGLDTTDVVAVNEALATPIGATGIQAWQAAFLGLPPTEAGLESFKIDSISFNDDGKVIVTLPAYVSPKTGRGVDIALKLMGSDDLSNWTFIEAAGGADGKTFAPVTPALGETKKFYIVQAVFTATEIE